MTALYGPLVWCVWPAAKKGNRAMAVAAASDLANPGPVQLWSVQRFWYSWKLQVPS